MPWCPVCKNEYVEGITHCPDCDVDLVDELSEEELKNDSIEIPADYEFPEDFDPREVLEEDLLSEPGKKAEPAKSYKSPEERYEDMHSSAWTFLLVGIAGTAVMILCWLGIINLPVYDFVLFVMTAMFVIFVFIGIVSFQTAQKIKATIASEHSFMEEVIQWYHTTGCESPAFAELDPEQSEEILYLQKSEIIRSLLKEQFPDIDQALLEKLTDDFCEEAFSD